jgi:hypothetical protein
MTGTDLQARARARLLELAGGRGVSLSALSGLLGRNPAYLQQFVRKGSPRKLEDDRRVLANFFGVSESELGAPPMGFGKRGRGGRRRPRAGRLGGYSAPAAGSLGRSRALARDEAPSGQLRFSARWLKAQGLDPVALSVIAVEGDSMEPTLRDGDEISSIARRALRAGIHVIRLTTCCWSSASNPARPARCV